ncbi:hypothetical protein ACPDIX_14995 [Limisphaera sp. 4302-co]
MPTNNLTVNNSGGFRQATPDEFKAIKAALAQTGQGSVLMNSYFSLLAEACDAVGKRKK